jgi:beta-xylosidase/AraC-like DNA-binding protein
MNVTSDETGLVVYRPTGTWVHVVPGLELVLLLSGMAHIEVGTKICRLSEGDILLLERQERIRIRPVNAAGTNTSMQCFLLVLKIGKNLLSLAFPDGIPNFVCDSTSPSCPDCTALKKILAEIACIENTVGQLQNEVGVGGRSVPLFHSRILVLLYELESHFCIPKKKETGEAERKQFLDSYIKKNFRYPLTLQDLSENFSLSPTYLSSYFKKTFGANFHTYLNHIRLENARKDLALSGDSITTVAYDNGFPNLTSFLKELKESTGLTPTEYRKRVLEEIDSKEPEPEINGMSLDMDIVKERLRPFLPAGKGEALQEKLIIDADARKGSSYRQIWKEVINLGFARDFFKSAFIEQVKLLQKNAPFRYGRFQGLFGKSIFTIGGKPREPNFVQIDRIIDFLYSVHLIPFIELGFKPDKINRRTDDLLFHHDDEIEQIPIDEYEEAIDHFLLHAVNRYGEKEVNQWIFELWIPSKIDYTEEELDTYTEQFQRIQKKIKGIVPLALVGGPGVNLGMSNCLTPIKKIAHNLYKHDGLPDFFSFYIYFRSDMPYSNGNDRTLFFWKKDEMVRQISLVKESVQSQYPAVNRFFVTEWNLDYSCRNHLHDSLLKAPFVLYNAISSIDVVDALGYWPVSDISAEYSDSDAILFGGAGLISRYGIFKPPFFAYHFLSLLGDSLLSKGDGYIVTAKSKNEYSCIIFNYKYLSNESRLRDDFQNYFGDPLEFLENIDNLAVTLRLNNAQKGRYKITQHVLNTRQGSLYDTWKRLSFIKQLSVSEISWLQQTCVPSLQIDIVSCTGTLTLEYELEPNEVRLITINRILE